jgi:uracil-DNA glycosylase
MDTISATANSPIEWKDILANEKRQQYFVDILSFIEKERTNGKEIYPPNSQIFNALLSTPFSKVKVVILGQDPYHGPKQAHGLAFSVQKGVPPPPSLINIFKELSNDLGIKRPSHGCLEKWAEQGVLLLNAFLSVERGKPCSHSKIGWERFTDKVLEVLNLRKQGLVYLLWGAFAQNKAQLIDPARHFILKAPHPSPLSASRGFFGCKHFSRANELIKKLGKEPIDWKLD